MFTKKYYISTKKGCTTDVSISINKKIGSKKAIVVTGARQVGKTTLIESILESKNYLFL